MKEIYHWQADDLQAHELYLDVPPCGASSSRLTNKRSVKAMNYLQIQHSRGYRRSDRTHAWFLREAKEKRVMRDWLHKLSIVWMVVLVFGITYLIALAIFAVVMSPANGEGALGFKAVSPEVLPPLVILFGFFVGFIAVQVWNDNDRAIAVVDREASVLRAVLTLAVAFPEGLQARLRALIHGHIEEAATREWSLMAHHTATLNIIPSCLAEALQHTLTLTPNSEGQRISQHEMTIALESALDARGQRIPISQSQVGPVKWLCLFAQAICALIAIAIVHSDNRLGAIIVLILFATGTATCVLLILSYDQPFNGQLAISPSSLLQVMPEVESVTRTTPSHE